MFGTHFSFKLRMLVVWFDLLLPNRKCPHQLCEPDDQHHPGSKCCHVRRSLILQLLQPTCCLSIQPDLQKCEQSSTPRRDQVGHTMGHEKFLLGCMLVQFLPNGPFQKQSYFLLIQSPLGHLSTFHQASWQWRKLSHSALDWMQFGTTRFCRPWFQQQRYGPNWLQLHISNLIGLIDRYLLYKWLKYENNSTYFIGN